MIAPVNRDDSRINCFDVSNFFPLVLTLTLLIIDWVSFMSPLAFIILNFSNYSLLKNVASQLLKVKKLAFCQKMCSF